MSRDMDGMLPWQRHDFIMQFHPSSRAPAAQAAPTRVRSDMDAIRDHHRFIREDEGTLGPDSSWEERLAARYYKKLVKEYAIVDLGRYKEGKVGMRWRTETEVVSGKGQFECASVTCRRTRGLRSFEVPFIYKEQGETKKALVKARVCEECAPKLYWKKTKELEKLSQLLSVHNGDTEVPREKPETHKHKKRSRDSPELSGGSAYPGKSSRKHSLKPVRDEGAKVQVLSDEAVDKLIDELLL